MAPRRSSAHSPTRRRPSASRARQDIAPRNRPEKVDEIDGALGELSPFHTTHGFYVHGVPIETAMLPEGWQMRTVPVPGRGARPATGWCIEAHDLAASKLVAFRDKDRAFVRTLIVEGLISPDVLVARVQVISMNEQLKDRLSRWIDATRGDP